MEGAKRIAQEMLWDVESRETDWSVDRSQVLASAVSVKGQNQSMPRSWVWRERKVAQVGLHGGLLEIVRVRASGRAEEMVADGKREARAGLAAARGLTRRRGQEWKDGWVAWRAARNVPKPQLTEIHPVGWCLWRRSREAECAGGVEGAGVEGGVVWMGREERVSAVVVAVGDAMAMSLAIGAWAGHLVVYWGNREGSNAAGLA